MFENPCYPSNEQCFRGDFSNSMDRTWHRRLISYRRMSRSACTQIFFSNCESVGRLVCPGQRQFDLERKRSAA